MFKSQERPNNTLQASNAMNKVVYLLPLFSKPLIAVSALSAQIAVGAPVEQAERNNGLAFQKAVSEAIVHDFRKRDFWEDFVNEFKEDESPGICNPAALQGKGPAKNRKCRSKMF